MQARLVEESSCSTYLGLFPRTAGVEVVGRADGKWQVPEKHFPTDREGNRTEESKHDQRVLGHWWPHHAEPSHAEQGRTQHVSRSGGPLLPCPLGVGFPGVQPTQKLFCFGYIS